MKLTMAALCIGVSLGALLSLPKAGHTQSPCQNIDEPGRGADFRSSSVAKNVREASPEALSFFRTLIADRVTGRIVGGHLVGIENNSWQVAMIRANVQEPRRSQFCGGSIIGDNWVLTAAHCVRNAVVREDPKRVDVVTGTSQWAIGGERLKVSQIHTHPKYDDYTKDNDFALLRLESRTTMGRAIRIADEATQVPAGSSMCVSGWGATFEGGPGSLDLMGVEVPAVPNDECNKPESYGGDVTANMMCAGRMTGGIDSCQGDSGGPLSMQVGGHQTLVGVVSWGEGCARRLKYGIYARVSVAAPWIASITGASASR